ncbi:zinc ribbon domain-containing protein [Cohnella rhizosphaerae]|uniref:Zinc ribbon domain-containing protein n=1 Tax=Cohnella rhizosphaerae TaxID=1457232 RepID=A0A9X4KX25_9BACL|nr:zinc ribbon domain-containing protein [Cohnella rhizosphaerae]MDG0812884.1 zinc ribbon domain-containing protein [Cohnella rhizosphaerae]
MECPYCQAALARVAGRCPNCGRKLYEVTEEDFEESALSAGSASEDDGAPIGADGEEPTGIRELAETLESRFVCRRCGNHGGIAKEVAMTGAGLSKLLDVQHRHYLFVSCERCGNVEIYDPEVLLGRKPGMLGTLLDALFGG